MLAMSTRKDRRIDRHKPGWNVRFSRAHLEAAEALAARFEAETGIPVSPPDMARAAFERYLRDQGLWPFPPHDESS